VPVLTSRVDPDGETYRANRAAQLAVLDELGKQLELAIAGGGERYQQRHRDRGRLLARERIELLVDPDSPFLELSALAAWGTGFTVGASLVTGIGVISGVECVIIAHDPTVRGGAMNPYSLRKTLRALEIARINRLPVMNLVESGGADLPTQADLFVPAGRIFHELTELSASAVPTVALVFGNSTAGGAYVPGMCDYAVLVDGRAKVFLGGPPLVKMATGEESGDESLGGTSLATGWARVHGYPVGVLANHRGVLFSEEAKKASEFILLANSTDTPLVFLQNTTGYMVGASYEQGGIIKDGAKMINAVTNSAVPHLTINMASSFGAGNYGMSGRAYDPRFMFAWPGAKLAVMGAAQLAGVLSIVGRASAAATGRPFDEEADRARTATIEAQIEAESHSFFVTARLYDDGIIDPRDTRTVLGLALSAVHNAPVAGRRGFGVFRM